jgi:hypothetical protein
VERRRGQLALGVEVGPQPAADDGEHDVVDGGTRHGRSDPLRQLEIKAKRVADAVCRGLPVEWCRRQARRAGALGLGQWSRAHGRHRRGEQLQEARRREGDLLACPGERLPGCRIVLAPPRVERGCSPVRAQIVEGVHQLDAGYTVDRRMVHLDEDAEASLRKVPCVVETLDDVELPGRAAEVERVGVQSGCLDPELAPVARGRQGDVADVELEIEVPVLHPVRVIKVKWHAYQLPAEHPRQGQAMPHLPQDRVEGDLSLRSGRRVVDVERADVHRHPRRLGVQEPRILLAKLLHVVLPFCALRTPAGLS